MSARRKVLIAALLASLATLAACAFLEKPQATIPTKTIAAQTTRPSSRVVIVLPGQGDTIATLANSGIASVIQRHLPDAEIILAEATLPYYAEGRLARRLHDQYVQPARQRGAQEIYLVGASLGGAGVLLYETAYPRDVTGLILMAPYMGDASLAKEIVAAGGLRSWQAGPQPSQLTRDNFTREEWRTAQSWSIDRERAKAIWLICGERDKFHAAAEIIATALPSGHYFKPEGGHAWKVWIQGAEHAFENIAAASRQARDKT